MTYDEFISLIKQPERLSVQHVSDLKELVDRYPYFVPARLFLTKALQISNSIYFESSLKLASLYSPSRRWLYYYVHPEINVSKEPYQRPKNGSVSGNYFDMINVVERGGGDARESLKIMAEKLKSARSMVVSSSNVKIAKPEIALTKDESIENAELNKSFEGGNRKILKLNNDIIQQKSENEIYRVSEDYFPIVNMEISEDNAKKLITNRKYKQAITILKELNLINPKKSVYFADQIRFLEKVVENSKK